ncbi:hypothetical protein [Oceanospirillum sediminis]|uniref:Uncharacterized protein n=1 Tax=Oceanospirillum sediminis TaxID=2760088 RepID=A0A839INC8_9GAMM|nr:hypothetical protein [Oceanospirillum sediminis]MBB1486009.1 hypothetical protein [Oceanospirillum sediminis]
MSTFLSGAMTKSSEPPGKHNFLTLLRFPHTLIFLAKIFRQKYLNHHQVFSRRSLFAESAGFSAQISLPDNKIVIRSLTPLFHQKINKKQ